MNTIEITKFAERHFRKRGAGTRIDEKHREELLESINASLDQFKPTHTGRNPIKGGYEYLGAKLLDGYADFCKLLIIPNRFDDIRTGTSKITNENYQWLRSDYVSRNDSELPVLTRSLHLPMLAEKAEYLVFVLYTAEHLKKEFDSKVEESGLIDPLFSELEHKQMLEEEEGIIYDLEEFPDAKWGVVSIMAQMVNIEEPMNPATMTRNHLGEVFGGSGVDIDKDYYLKSVEFWKNNALVKQ